MRAGQRPSGTPKLRHCLELVEAAEAPAEVLKVVKSYLDAWPKERVDSIQRVDGGWAPFDSNQRPSQVDGVRNLRRIRDVVHRHCMFLREAGMALTPELVELDEFFLVATEMAENLGLAASQARTPAIPPHRDVLVNW